MPVLRNIRFTPAVPPPHPTPPQVLDITDDDLGGYITAGACCAALRRVGHATSSSRSRGQRARGAFIVARTPADPPPAPRPPFPPFRAAAQACATWRPRAWPWTSPPLPRCPTPWSTATRTCWRSPWRPTTPSPWPRRCAHGTAVTSPAWGKVGRSHGGVPAPYCALPSLAFQLRDALPSCPPLPPRSVPQVKAYLADPSAFAAAAPAAGGAAPAAAAAAAPPWRRRRRRRWVKGVVGGPGTAEWSTVTVGLCSREESALALWARRPAAWVGQGKGSGRVRDKIS